MLLCFSYSTILLNWVWQVSQMNPSNGWFLHSFLVWLKLEVVFSWILACFSVGCESEGICVSGWDILVVSRTRSSGFFFFSLDGGWSLGKSNCSSGIQTFLCPMYSIRVLNPVPQCPQLKVSNSEPNLFGFSFSFSSCLFSSAPVLGSESLLVLVLLSDRSLSVFSFLLVLGVLCLAAAAGVQKLSRLLMPNSARWAILHWSNCNVLPWRTKLEPELGTSQTDKPSPRACEWAGCSRLSKPCTYEIWCESWEHHLGDPRTALWWSSRCWYSGPCTACRDPAVQ